MTDRTRTWISSTDGTGRPVGSAEIEFPEPDTARANLHVESGQLPAGAREKLVDAVLDDAAVCSCAQLQLAVPLGDTAMLDRVRERCAVHGTRAAGSSLLVDVTPPAPEPGG